MSSNHKIYSSYSVQLLCWISSAYTKLEEEFGWGHSHSANPFACCIALIRRRFFLMFHVHSCEQRSRWSFINKTVSGYIDILDKEMCNMCNGVNRINNAQFRACSSYHNWMFYSTGTFVDKRCFHDTVTV